MAMFALFLLLAILSFSPASTTFHSMPMLLPVSAAYVSGSGYLLDATLDVPHVHVSVALVIGSTDVGDTLTSLSSSISALQAAQTLTAKSGVALSDFTVLQQQVASLSALVTVQGGLIASLTANLSACSSHVLSSQSSSADQSSQIASLTSITDNLQLTTSGLLQTNHLEGILLIALQQSNITAQAKLTTLGEQINSLTSTTTTLQQEQIGLMSTTSASITALQTSNSSTQSSVAALSARTTAIEALSPITPPTNVYSTVSGIATLTGTSAIVSAVIDLNERMAALNHTLMALPNGRTSTSTDLPVCWPLTLSVFFNPIVGAGLLFPSLAQSKGCPTGSYVASESFLLLALPTVSNWALSSWSGAVNSSLNPVPFTMPSSAAVVSGLIGQCWNLLLSSLGSGSVVASPSQSPDCPLGMYLSGRTVTIVATPNGITNFTEFFGSLPTSFTNPMQFVFPSSDTALVASFVTCFTFSVDASPVGSGSFRYSGANSNGCPSGSYTSGASIQITAIPISGWTFTTWSGASSSTFVSFPFTMPTAAAAYLTAHFAQCYPLLVVAGAGGAVGTPSPTQSIGCILGSYISGAIISLTAVPTAGLDVFAAWIGSATNSTSLTLALTMPAAAVNLTAIFNPCYSLTMIAGDGGSLSALSPAATPGCSAGTFVRGTNVAVTAIAGLGYGFTTWSGGSNSTTATLTFSTAAVPAVLIANFSRCYALTTVVANGNSSGSITVSGISNAGCGENSFFAGTSVTLTATPNSAAFIFVNFGGFMNSTQSVISFLMPASSATLVATFSQCLMLSVGIGNGGAALNLIPTSTVGCGSGSFVAGQAIEAQAIASTSYRFQMWSGISTSTAASISFTMPSAANYLNAQFQQCFSLILVARTGGTISLPTPLSSPGCAMGTFISGSSITVIANASFNAVFQGWSESWNTTALPNTTWSGASISTSASLSFTMPNTNTVLTAQFTDCLPLTFSVTGLGTVWMNPTSSPGCFLGSFFWNAAVQVNAAPSPSYGFMGWTGGLSQYTTSIVSYTMPATPVSATANFGTLCTQSYFVSTSLSITVTRDLTYTLYGGKFNF
jgi:hypothetical protein